MTQGHVDNQYAFLVKQILRSGQERKNERTGVVTKSIFGHHMRFDLSEGFPLLTTKKLSWKSIAHELLWFIRGETNDKYLIQNGVTIWDEWADKETRELGPIYGYQWRHWQGFNSGMNGVDQLQIVINSLRNDPSSRRHIVSAWNVGDLPDMALAPCHMLFQFYVDDGALSCMMTQRSVDVGLGLPFNIASYALLTHLVARVVGLKVGELIMSLGDTHIYENHYEKLAAQAELGAYYLPSLVIFNSSVNNIDDFKYEDFGIVGYESHPHFKLDVAV